MRLHSFVAWLLLGLALCTPLHAQLVAPPSVDWVSLPATATVGSTVSVGVGAHANPSDNSDGNNWNTPAQLVVARVIVDELAPGSSTWTHLYDWLPTWQTPATIWTSFSVTAPGTYYVRVQLMDGRPWYSGVYTYAISVPTPAPAITSSLSVGVNQGQSVSYAITATNSPTSFGATGLPAGLSLNSATGVISGSIPTNGGTQGGSSTVSSTISATNSAGTDTKTLTWTITAAAITTTSSVSPGTINLGASVTLTRSGSANFGIAWTENTIWKPDGTALSLGNQQLGSQTYTPAAVGSYSYQFRLVDGYTNYRDQWMSFTVIAAVVPPTTAQATSVGSYSVTLSWSGASAAAGIGGYNIYRNGTKINGTLVTSTGFTDSTPAPGTSYTYTINTVDVNGVESTTGATVYVNTAASFELFTPTP